MKNFVKAFKSMQSKTVSTQSGVALMLAMFTVVLVSYLATEISYETNVEYLVNSQAIQGIKAYYAAKSGLQLSLLRIKALGMIDTQIPKNFKTPQIQAMIDKIVWQMPFAWPFPVPAEVNDVDKNLIKDALKLSTMDAGYSATIVDEGSKIDLNDLASPVEVLRDLTKKRLLELFENKKKFDSKWIQAHSDMRYDQIINQIQDWVTAGNNSVNGGDKRQIYSGMGEGYPPNRGFRTIDEVHLIPTVTDDFFAVIKDSITVYGMRALNPNHASKEVFMSLDPSIIEKIADEIVARRDDMSKGGPYKDAKDFWQAVAGFGARVDPNVQNNLPVICDTVSNFRIKSVGNYKSATRSIEVVVLNVQQTALQLAQSLTQATQSQGSTTGTGTGTGSSGTGQNSNSTSGANNPSKGPPRIVYWNEK